MYDLLIFEQGLAPLCPCRKSVPCPVIYAIPVVVSYIEVQILKYRQESGHKYVVRSLFLSCLRKCKQGAGNRPGAHLLTPASVNRRPTVNV